MERFKSSLNYIGDKLTQKWTLVGVVAVIAILSFTAIYAAAGTEELEVYFFDVGQGDAIFVDLPDGRQILIDGGPSDKVVEKLNSVMPFWDRSIDIVIATHADSDHLTGLVPVLGHYNVNTIIWNGITAETKIFKEWKDAADTEGAEMLVGEYGMRIEFSDTTFIEMLYPLGSSQINPLSSRKGQNDFSLVVRLVYGNDSFLFTGDIERQGEYTIANQGLNLKSDILKIAHHGSKTSSSELFLEIADPKVAVISSALNNSYGHPHKGILQRLEKYGIQTRRTDSEGDILILSNGNSF